MPKSREGGVHFVACLPPEVKRWLEAEAKANFSSQNSELVRAVRARMDLEKAAG
jgi:hypothetical protein